jgi:hypothetical protein
MAALRFATYEYEKTARGRWRFSERKDLLTRACSHRSASEEM